ncbi:DEAD/DEAH box helicase [Aquariibacter albus]|nr:DEAD/DEAH box helicase [Aquariibacter albus]
MTTLDAAAGHAMSFLAEAEEAQAPLNTVQEVAEPVPTEPQAPNAFLALGLIQPLVDAVAALGYTAPTPVQAQAVPSALAGGDWMVSSQTGSGKTAAFLLPVLQRLLTLPPAAASRVAAPRAIVLCPTRELAQQVASDAIDLMRGVSAAMRSASKHDKVRDAVRGLRVATIVGGMAYGKQLFDLRGADLVVATPGRLLDLQERKQIRLDLCHMLVVDEADRMLDLGFAEDLAALHDATAHREQTMMFSATFAPRIMTLASRVMREPGRLELATAQDRHTDITQTLHWADNLDHKHKLLEHWLRDVALEQAVVFASTQVDTEALAETLQQMGHAAVALHGAMPQGVRNRRLQNLRDGHIRVLVATDVAARGIDVPTISHVINFGLPMKAEDYVHRIGRTGRAGRSGHAITLAEHRERAKIRAIEAYTRQTLVPTVIPGLEPTPQAPKPRRDKPMPGFRKGQARAGGGGGGRWAEGGGGGGYGAPRPEGGAPRGDRGPGGFRNDRGPRGGGR